MARHRYDLTDAEWKIIQPLLPQKSRGVERVDDRRVLNGIFWRLRSGAPWAEIPEQLKLTAGQAHDGKSAEDMLDDVGKGTVLLADRGYDSDAIREKLEQQGARANIRPLEHRLVKPRFSPKAYRQRNLVERFFNKLKHYRAIATRFCRHDANYLASVQMAALRIWLRFNESVT